jgi:glycosyltransferase involved in cell wall biosynthesis
MLITVAICTWNRSSLLREALGSLARSQLPADLAWEVLVVDNGSSDDTKGVVAELRDALPIRCVLEPAPGLSHARNRCVDEANGSYILWTDDDVIVDRGWLREYARAFRELPNAAVFGGPVRARFEGSLPAWLAAAWPQVESAYGIRDLGSVVKRLTSDQLPFGSNYAVRRSEQRRHRYDPRLGRNRHALLGGEETAVLSAIVRDGVEAWWLPQASVDHWIPRDRQTVGYLERYYRGQGQVRALREAASNLRKPAAFGRPLWLWRQALEAEAAYRLNRTLRRPEQWAASLVKASIAWGLLAGWNGSDPA